MRNTHNNIAAIAQSDPNRAPKQSTAAMPRDTAMPRRAGHRGRFRRGGAVIEAVLVLSLVQMLSFGAAEYGYGFYVKHALQSAAAVGVRTAILASSTDASVRTAITSQLTLTGMQNSNYTVTTIPASVTNCPAGTYVTVTVANTWGNIGISPLPTSMGGIPASKSFSAAATMVHE
jgi:Flp pilus assembly protein TadG